MNVKKIGAVIGAAAMLAAGAVVGIATPASAHPTSVIQTSDQTAATCGSISDGGTSTNLNADGWASIDTRSAGHAVYVAGGLHLYTDDASSNAKVSWGHAYAGSLASLGTSIAVDYTSTFGAAPGLNAYVDFGNGLHGTLVWEAVYGGADWWLTDSSSAGIVAPETGGGFGSARHGTLDEWVAGYPNATVNGIAFSLGSGVHADGILHSLTIGCAKYSFSYATPAPQQCTVGSENFADYATEDVAPTLVAAGLEFNGTTANGKAVDIYHPENDVPLAGLDGLAYTIAGNTSGGPDPAYVLEIHDGTVPNGKYATLSWEPYQNGKAIDATGTFSNLESGIWWSSKIANPAPGSQSSPQTLAWFEQTYPSAVVISHGVHLGSASSTSVSVVSSVVFRCATTTFATTTDSTSVTSTTTSTPAASGLAATGSNIVFPLVAGGAIIVLGGGALTFALIRRRKIGEDR